MRTDRLRRRGICSLWAIVVMSLLGFFFATITTTLTSNQTMLRQRQYLIQARWLANSGLDIAAERLLAEPASYKGETATLVTNGKLDIKMQVVAGQTDHYQVKVVARYPTDSAEGFTIQMEQKLRRTVEGGKVRLATIHIPKEEAGIPNLKK